MHHGRWIVILVSLLALGVLLSVGFAACGGADDDDDADDDDADDDAADDDAGDDTDDDAGDDTDDDVDDDADDDTDDDATDDDTGDDDTGTSPPDYPNDHDPSWNCYLCHEAPFNGAPGEPHGGQYNAPGDCVGCHQEGDSPGDPHGPGGHNFILNCLDCHEGQHGKDWQHKSQCVVCHQP